MKKFVQVALVNDNKRVQNFGLLCTKLGFVYKEQQVLTLFNLPEMPLLLSYWTFFIFCPVDLEIEYNRSKFPHDP